MYGPTTSELVGGIVVIAVVGGLLGVGAEHGVLWLWHHVAVVFR